MAKKNKKFLVKLNALFMQSQARDVISGIMFNQTDAVEIGESDWNRLCLLYTSPSPRDRTRSRMPSSA